MLNYLKKSRAILGINESSLTYVRRSFLETGTSVVANKLKTKKILQKFGVPVPKTFKIIKNREDLEKCSWNKLPNSFVVKPNLSTQGRGILIVFGKEKQKDKLNHQEKAWIQADGRAITIRSLRSHVSKILKGLYSYNVVISDVAFFEKRLKVHPVLKPYCSRGIPDVRVIVYNKIPVMAELRLPTSESHGLSNLHQGGIGIGIDMDTGATLAHGVWNKKRVDRLPGKKKLLLSGIKIPFWKEILEMSIKTQLALKLNYIGVDIVLDREKGPLVVEANARPGLAIQVANLAPLKSRLEKTENIKVKSVKQGVRLARDLFGGEIEEELEEISGKKVIGITEPVEVIDAQGKKHSFIAKIDTGTLKTQIQEELFNKLNLEGENKLIAPLSFIINDVLIETEVLIINDPQSKYEITIGRKDLKKFLIDPAKIYLKSKKLLRKKI